MTSIRQYSVLSSNSLFAFRSLYGDHTFQVMSRLDEMDPDVVLGMFLYA